MIGRTLNHARKTRGQRRGNAIIELAVTLTILTNLAFGLVEFGYFYYVKNALVTAAHLGCRQAILPLSTNTGTTASVNAALTPYNFPSSSCTVSITDTSGNALTLANIYTVGTYVEVKVTATWSVIGAGFRPLSLISGSKVVTGACVMAHE